ncbi:MAG TPA: crossover junction endodeoxyribonuclease RuvC [Terriglobales bacterium]|nr:crossover junction endodeoxyribonuclease RuvC [Terriglobales bacterium]
MIVVGIDCGSVATGYGVVESDWRRHRARVSGTIRLPRASQASFAERLDRIHGALSELLERERPDCVAIEEVFYAKNVRSALQLSHVRGVAMQAAAALGLPVFEYSPRTIKSALTGYGDADKTQVLHMVRSLLCLEEDPGSLDASDALAVAICHIHSAPPTARG